MDGMRMFSLFDDSNVEAYDKRDDRYPAVLKAGLSHNGLDLEDVLAVTADFYGLWAICNQGIFKGALRGWFRKRIETFDLIPYADIAEARVEPMSPHAGKIVMYDISDKKSAEIEFSAGGPRRSVEGEQAQCRRVLEIIEGAWRAAGAA